MARRARLDGVHAQDVGDELVVYDKPANRTHRLNGLAGLVWRLADGQRDASAIVAELHERHGVVTDVAIVELALLDLGSAGLLEPEADIEPGLSRRALLTLIGQGALAAALLPIVASLSANALPDFCFTRPGSPRQIRFDGECAPPVAPPPPPDDTFVDNDTLPE